jgi:methionyl aminopeptidase
MISLKSSEDIAILRQGGTILAQILQKLAKYTKAGITSLELENEARRLTAEAGAVPAFLGYQPEGADRPYPAALCLSINDVVVHGIPNEDIVIVKEGDIVVLDMGISYKQRIVDSAITVAIGEVDERGLKLMQACKECLDAAIEALKHWPEDFPNGIKSGDVGHVIEKTLEHYRKKYGFHFADGLGGHGVGFSVHEDPFMPNIGKRGQGPILKPGLVVAIEPIVNEGKPDIYLEDDGYTIKTNDGKRSVQFEHTIAITETGAEVLTEAK